MLHDRTSAKQGLRGEQSANNRHAYLHGGNLSRVTLETPNKTASLFVPYPDLQSAALCERCIEFYEWKLPCSRRNRLQPFALVGCAQGRLPASVCQWKWWHRIFVPPASARTGLARHHEQHPTVASLHPSLQRRSFGCHQRKQCKPPPQCALQVCVGARHSLSSKVCRFCRKTLSLFLSPSNC